MNREVFLPLKEARNQFVCGYVARALEASRGSVTGAARLLGVSHQMLSQMIERHQELRERRTPKRKRLKSIIKAGEGGGRCFDQNRRKLSS